MCRNNTDPYKPWESEHFKKAHEKILHAVKTLEYRKSESQEIKGQLSGIKYARYLLLTALKKDWEEHMEILND